MNALSTARTCPEREVGHDNNDDEESEPCGSHQPGAGDVSRALRFDSGDRGNGGNENREAKPCEPGHDDDSIHRCTGGSLVPRPGILSALSAPTASC
jgi:hypothetical protein